MPDDFTPKRTTGQALSGHRWTDRLAYRVHSGGFTLRMPSVTSIKAFEQQTGCTFDAPVSAQGAVSRWASTPGAPHLERTNQPKPTWPY